jgi:hypothetical protein
MPLLVWEEEEEEPADLRGLRRSRISFMESAPPTPPPPDFCFSGLLNTENKARFVIQHNDGKCKFNVIK